MKYNNKGDVMALRHDKEKSKIEIVFFEENGEGTLNVDRYSPKTKRDLAQMLNYFMHGGDEQPDCMEVGLYLETTDKSYDFYVSEADYVFVSDDSDYSDTISYIEYLLTEDLEIVDYWCDDNLWQYADSMLFDSGTEIAQLVCCKKDKSAVLSLEVRGHVALFYKGEKYCYASDFPDELTNLISTNPDWELDENIYVDENNWFEVLFSTKDGKATAIEDFSGCWDGFVFEEDVSQLTPEEMKGLLLDIAAEIIKEGE